MKYIPFIFQKQEKYDLKLGSYAQFAPGANLHPGCKFAPLVYFCHVNGVLRICTRVQICKFAPSFEVEQIYLHPGANCAYERKMFNFYTEF